MSDKQKTIVSLSLALQTCSAALASISDILQSKTDHSSSSSRPPSVELPVLHKDLLSLLSLLHASTTKLSLALKPSSPSYTASLVPLKDISDHISALSHCINLFDPTTHGATIIREAVFLIKDVIEAIRALLQTFLNIEANGTDVSTGQAGDEYMVRTGAVHDLIDKARVSNGLSKDNFVAARKKWTQDQYSLEDGLREVGEMVEDAESSDRDDEEECGDDDGWGEMGLGPGKKMDKDELERTKKLHAILRLSTLLHKRVILDLLQCPSDSPSPRSMPINAALDSLVFRSSALLSASDELISTLYTPQDPANMAKELVSFQGTLNTLQSSLRAFFPDTSLETQLGDMNIHGAASGTGRAAGKKGSRVWFDTGFEHMHKAARALTTTLELHTET